MFNYQSSNSFLRKFFYYLKNILNLFIPNFFYRRKLNKILSRPLDEETISRVNYYFKQNGEIELTANAKNIYEIFFNQLKKNKQNSHFFDFYNLAKFFKTNYKFEYIYNSPNYIGSNIAKRKSLFPIFVKSRPIIDNENSLLLKINQIKLFHFINDKLDFKSKKNVAIWRGDSRNNSKRN